MCDAGASYLSSLSGGVTTFSLRSIVSNFFREHSTVSYIMVVRTVSSGDLRSVGLTRDVFLNGYLQTKASDDQLVKILHRSIDILPRPARLAINAYRSVPGWFRLLENSHFGGGAMSSKTSQNLCSRNPRTVGRATISRAISGKSQKLSANARDRP